MQKLNTSRPRIGSRSAHTVQMNWQYMIVMLVCGGILAAGFFFAARQHFMSMDYGFKNSKLKKQLEDLEAEKRRLMLAREVSLSPTELRKAAIRAAARKQSSATPQAVAAVAKVATPADGRSVASTASGESVKAVRAAYAAAPADGSDRASRGGDSHARVDGIEIAAVTTLR